jgi:hypothetical protein
MCGRTPGDVGSCCSRDVSAVTLASAISVFSRRWWSGPVGCVRHSAGPLVLFAQVDQTCACLLDLSTNLCKWTITAKFGRMSDEPKDVRLPVMVTRSEAVVIDEWRFQNRIASRAEAIRRLIQLGLDASVQGSRQPPAEPRKPRASAGRARQ